MTMDVHRVLQWNTQGISTAKEDILKLIDIHTNSTKLSRNIFGK